jgi:arylformamidase
MINETLEAQYVISKLKSNLPELMADWAARSLSYRAEANASYDIAYGEDPHERVDLFYSGADNAPLLVYFHGGYWQRGDKSLYSFIAKPFVESGVDVAVVGYPLCPQVSLSSLVNSIRQSLIFLFNHADNLNINRERFNLCGNSAGGHLVAMMMATRWHEIDSKLSDDLIKFGAPISALYQLEPLRQTSLNEAIGLDKQEAKANSPQFLSLVNDAPILAALGGAETSEFFTQTDVYIEQSQNHSRVIEKHIEPDADHFDIIDHLGDSGSEIFKAIYQRLR